MKRATQTVLEIDDSDAVSWESNPLKWVPFRDIADADVVIYNGKVLKNKNGPAWKKKHEQTVSVSGVQCQYGQIPA